MGKLKVAYFGGRILGYKCLQILAKYRDRVDVCFVVADQKDGQKGSDLESTNPAARQKVGI